VKKTALGQGAFLHFIQYYCLVSIKNGGSATTPHLAINNPLVQKSTMKVHFQIVDSHLLDTERIIY